MILRTLVIVSSLVAIATTYDPAEAEDTKPIKYAEFIQLYKEYLSNIKQCGQRLVENLIKECKDKENNRFRTVTHRGVNCEVIEELSCKKGKFGTYEIIIDGNTQEVNLPC